MDFLHRQTETKEIVALTNVLQQKSYSKMSVLLADRFLYRPYTYRICVASSRLCEITHTVTCLHCLLKSYLPFRAQSVSHSARKHPPAKPSD